MGYVRNCLETVWKYSEVYDVFWKDSELMFRNYLEICSGLCEIDSLGWKGNYRNCVELLCVFVVLVLEAHYSILDVGRY